MFACFKRERNSTNTKKERNSNEAQCEKMLCCGGYLESREGTQTWEGCGVFRYPQSASGNEMKEEPKAIFRRGCSLKSNSEGSF